MTERREVSTHEWQILKRLDAAGCPIPWDELEEPCCPLRVHQEPPALGTELFALSEKRMALAVRLRIIASRRFSSQRIALQTNWIQGTLTSLLVEDGVASFPCSGGEVRFAAAGLLNGRLTSGYPSKTGRMVWGYLVGVMDQPPIPPSEKSLPATLVIYDQWDRSYPYHLDLVNTQRITGHGDEDCCFVSASQPEQEEAARVAAEAEQAEPPKPRPPALWIPDKVIDKWPLRNRRY